MYGVNIYPMGKDSMSLPIECLSTSKNNDINVAHRFADLGKHSFTQYIPTISILNFTENHSTLQNNFGEQRNLVFRLVPGQMFLYPVAVDDNENEKFWF